MERAAKSSSDAPFAALAGPRKMVPDPCGHALLLIGTYGMSKALQIAQANRSLAAPDKYWAEVFQAVQRGERSPAFAVASEGGDDGDLRAVD